YDANAQCTAIKGPDGEVQQFAYSPLGLLTHQGDSSGKTTQYQYNGLSQVVKRIDPLGQTLDYHYDGERNLIGLTNEKGEDYHLRYDLNERLVEEVGFDGRVQQYHYNAAGHLTASDDISENGKSLLGRLHYQRDNAGRLIKQYAAAPQAANEQTPSRVLLNSFDYD
ncbi:Rhs family protein, partial [Psychromonas sp. Urea-02u-13]